MSAVRALRRMLDAGMPLETALVIAEAFEADVAEYARALLHSEAITREPAKLDAETPAERRKRLDRDRKRRKISAEIPATDAEVVRKGAEIPQSDAESAEIPLSRPLPPRTPPTPTHTPAETNTRTHEGRLDLTLDEPEKPARKRPSRRVPSDWEPNDKHRALVVELGLSTADARQALEMFRDHEFAKAHSDWDSAFRNWLRNDARRTNRNGRSPASRADRQQTHLDPLAAGIAQAADGGGGRRWRM